MQSGFGGGKLNAEELATIQAVRETLQDLSNEHEKNPGSGGIGFRIKNILAPAIKALAGIEQSGVTSADAIQTKNDWQP